MTGYEAACLAGVTLAVGVAAADIEYGILPENSSAFGLFVCVVTVASEIALALRFIA